jgi:putative oxidoreductase
VYEYWVSGLNRPWTEYTERGDNEMSMAATTTRGTTAPTRDGASPVGAVRVTARDLGLLVLRITLGLIFFAHGAQKALGWFGGQGIEATVASMAALGIPAPLAYAAVCTELVGGVALATGFFSRTAALGLAILMAVAMVKVHLPNGFFMNWDAVGGRSEGFEYNLALLAMTLTVLTGGPGSLTLVNGERALLRRILRRG